jgi:hypothetical protein
MKGISIFFSSSDTQTEPDNEQFRILSLISRLCLSPFILDGGGGGGGGFEFGRKKK